MKTKKTAAGILSLVIALLCAGCGSDGSSTADAVKHSYPETLLEYCAKEAGAEAADLSKAAVLMVYVNHCEYGEPEQYITDGSVISAAVKAVSGITVTGKPDGISSTGTHYGYCFMDADGSTIAGFSFQDGMLMVRDGRCPVTGLSELLAIEGVMLDDEWEEYWDAVSELRDQYEESFTPHYPESVFAISGYETNAFEDMPAEDVAEVNIYVSGNREAGKLSSGDSEVIANVQDALRAMRVTGVYDGKPEGQRWYVTFSIFRDAGFYDGASIIFTGDHLTDGNRYYTVEGLDALFGCAESEVLDYLRGHRLEPKPD